MNYLVILDKFNRVVTFQPIVKKNHTAVDCQGGDCDMLYRRNTTLIIISSMIKIITMGGRATPT
jgi:hypothetical protein